MSQGIFLPNTMRETPVTEKKYILQFNYTDNDQLYEDFLVLSDRDAERLKEALEVLTEVGDIRSADGEKTSVSMLQPYVEPEFRTFEQMKEAWEAGDLNDHLRDQDFDWETSD